MFNNQEPDDTQTKPTRDAIVWQALLDTIANFDVDQDTQRTALGIIAQVDTVDLPIAEITAMLLHPGENNRLLMIWEIDMLWAEGLAQIARDPNRVPLDLVIAVLRKAFEQDTDTEQIAGFIERLRGVSNPQPFIDLLRDPDPVMRGAGLEALYRLQLPDAIRPSLNDPDPDVCAIAAEDLLPTGRHHPRRNGGHHWRNNDRCRRHTTIIIPPASDGVGYET